MRLLIATLGLIAGCTPESKVEPIGEDDPIDQTPTEQPHQEGDGVGSHNDAITLDELAGAMDPEPSDYIYEEDTVEPLLSVDDVTLGIEVGIATALSVDPATLHQTYANLIATAYANVTYDEDDCPYYYDYYLEDYGYFYWYDTCTAPDDTSFSGYALSYDYSGLDSYPYYYPNYAYLSGNGSVTDPKGYTLDMAGYSYIYEYEYYGSYFNYHSGYTYGNFSYDNPDYAGTWLGQNLSVNLTFYAYQYNNDPASVVNQITGSLSGMSGDVNTIVLTDTYFYTAALGSNCEAEPSGTISVRDADGEWYDVYFQGPPYSGATVFPPDCDGCGQVYFRGEYLGESCPDFSILSSWEGRPW